MRLHPDAKTTPLTRELVVDRVLRLGWSAEAGKSYNVRLEGLSEPVEYTVHFVDCG